MNDQPNIKEMYNDEPPNGSGVSRLLPPKTSQVLSSDQAQIDRRSIRSASEARQPSKTCEVSPGCTPCWAGVWKA